MQKIETREYVLTKSKYFEILVKITLKRRVFILVAVVGVFALLSLFTSPGASAQRTAIIEMFVFIIVMPAFYFFACWRMANNPQNQRYQIPTVMAFDEDFMSFTKTNGEDSKLKTETIVKTRTAADCYLLYTTNIVAIVIPFLAFKTETDRLTFENMFKRRNVLK